MFQMNLRADILERVSCWESGCSDLTKRTCCVALGRWLSLSEPWSLHLKMQKLIYLTSCPFSGIMDSLRVDKIIEPFLKAVHFETHLITRRSGTPHGNHLLRLSSDGPSRCQFLQS